MKKAGTWKFYDKNNPNGTVSFQKVNDTNASTVQAAFSAANTALSPGNLNNLIGVDPAGHEFRYTSVDGKKKNQG